MKCSYREGEFLFRALFSFGDGWELTKYYFKDLDEAKGHILEVYGDTDLIKWPVEEISPGCLYLPTQEEIDGDHENR